MLSWEWEGEWGIFGDDVDEGTDSSHSSVGGQAHPGRGGLPKCLPCRQNKKKVCFIDAITDSLV